MTAKNLYKCTFSNGIRTQTDSDNWRSEQKLTKITSINRNTKNYTKENQMNKYKTEYLESQTAYIAVEKGQAENSSVMGIYFWEFIRGIKNKKRNCPVLLSSVKTSVRVLQPCMAETLLKYFIMNTQKVM